MGSGFGMLGAQQVGGDFATTLLLPGAVFLLSGRPGWNRPGFAPDQSKSDKFIDRAVRGAREAIKTDRKRMQLINLCSLCQHNCTGLCHQANYEIAQIM